MSHGSADIQNLQMILLKRYLSTLPEAAKARPLINFLSTSFERTAVAQELLAVELVRMRMLEQSRSMNQSMQRAAAYSAMNISDALEEIRSLCSDLADLRTFLQEPSSTSTR